MGLQTKVKKRNGIMATCLYYQEGYKIQNVLHLLEDQLTVETCSTNITMIKLICKDGHIMIHKVLLKAHSEDMGKVLLENEDQDIILADFNVDIVEKFCRLLYNGETVVSAIEKDSIDELATVFMCRKPKVEPNPGASIALRFSASTEVQLSAPPSPAAASTPLNRDSTLPPPSHRTMPRRTSNESRTGPTDTIQHEQVGPEPLSERTNRQQPIEAQASRRTERASSSASGMDSARVAHKRSASEKKANEDDQGSETSDASRPTTNNKRKRRRYEDDCMEEFQMSEDNSYSPSESENDAASQSEADGDEESGPETRSRKRKNSQNSEDDRRRKTRSSVKTTSNGTSKTSASIGAKCKHAFSSNVGINSKRPIQHRCFFCSALFPETESEALKKHLDDSCGKHLKDKFSFRTKACGFCKKTFPENSLAFYIQHVNNCFKIQDGRSKDATRCNTKTSVTPPTIESGVTTSGNDNENDSDSSGCEIITIRDFTLEGAVLPLGTAIRLRIEAAEKERRAQEQNQLSNTNQEQSLKQSESASDVTVTGATIATTDSTTDRQQQPLRYAEAGTSRQSVVPSRRPGPASKSGKPRGYPTGTPQHQSQSTTTTDPNVSQGNQSSAYSVRMKKLRNLFNCKVCFEKFNNIDSVVKCTRKHGFEICWICQELVQLDGGRRSGEDARKKECTYFNKRFNSHCSKKGHLAPLEDGSIGYECPVCEAYYSSEQLWPHIEEQHVPALGKINGKEYERSEIWKKKSAKSVVPSRSDTSASKQISSSASVTITGSGSKSSLSSPDSTAAVHHQSATHFATPIVISTSPSKAKELTKPSLTTEQWDGLIKQALLDLRSQKPNVDVLSQSIRHSYGKETIQQKEQFKKQNPGVYNIDYSNNLEDSEIMQRLDNMVQRRQLLKILKKGVYLYRLPTYNFKKSRKLRLVDPDQFQEVIPIIHRALKELFWDTRFKINGVSLSQLVAYLLEAFVLELPESLRKADRPNYINILLETLVKHILESREVVKGKGIEQMANGCYRLASVMTSTSTELSSTSTSATSQSTLEKSTSSTYQPATVTQATKPMQPQASPTNLQVTSETTVEPASAVSVTQPGNTMSVQKSSQAQPSLTTPRDPQSKATPTPAAAIARVPSASGSSRVETATTESLAAKVIPITNIQTPNTQRSSGNASESNTNQSLTNIALNSQSPSKQTQPIGQTNQASNMITPNATVTTPLPSNTVPVASTDPPKTSTDKSAQKTGSRRAKGGIIGAIISNAAFTLRPTANNTPNANVSSQQPQHSAPAPEDRVTTPVQVSVPTTSQPTEINAEPAENPAHTVQQQRLELEQNCQVASQAIVTAQEQPATEAETSAPSVEPEQPDQEEQQQLQHIGGYIENVESESVQPVSPIEPSESVAAMPESEPTAATPVHAPVIGQNEEPATEPLLAEAQPQPAQAEDQTGDDTGEGVAEAEIDDDLPPEFEKHTRIKDNGEEEEYYVCVDCNAEYVEKIYIGSHFCF